MSQAEADETKRDDELDLDEDRAAILQRRRRFVSATLGGFALATAALSEAACAPCLEVIAPQDVPTSDSPDASPQPCLSPVAPDASDPDASR